MVLLRPTSLKVLGSLGRRSETVRLGPGWEPSTSENGVPESIDDRHDTVRVSLRSGSR